MLIRPAAEPDLPAIASIYAHEAATGIATFDTEPRTLAFWESRLAGVETGDHLLVAEDAGEVIAYAMSSAYRPRPAYDRTRETSVYATEAARGRGVGRALYGALLDLLRADEVHLVVAVIALPNDASVALHRAFGFESVGVLHEVGRKFGRWIDTELFELRL
ncbi:MAG: pat [Nocardioides sp.]|jgi:phosphinothricin acetyltransferase|nr:pat [Nocardioides sp.]